MLAFFDGMRRYYHRDGLGGVNYFLQHRFYNRIVKPLVHANWLYWLDPQRILTRRYLRSIKQPTNSEIYAVGNYFLSTRHRLDDSSVVYSLGILDETSFDEEVARTVGCEVFMYDPSIIASRHLEKIRQPKFRFFPCAIWTTSKELMFYSPKYGGSPSSVLQHKGKTFFAPAITLRGAMKSNGHDRIDVLKMDIEGAALPILKQCVDEELLPPQIVAELERPRSKDTKAFCQFFADLDRTLQRLKNCGYEIRLLPRRQARYYSVEVLCFRILQDK